MLCSFVNCLLVEGCKGGWEMIRVSLLFLAFDFFVKVIINVIILVFENLI